MTDKTLPIPFKMTECYSWTTKHIVVCPLSSASSVSSINGAEEKTDGGWARDNDRNSAVFRGRPMFVCTNKIGTSMQLPVAVATADPLCAHPSSGMAAGVRPHRGQLSLPDSLSARRGYFNFETMGCNCADYRNVCGMGTREDEERAAARQWTARQMSRVLFKGVWVHRSIFSWTIMNWDIVSQVELQIPTPVLAWAFLKLDPDNQWQPLSDFFFIHWMYHMRISAQTLHNDQVIMKESCS